MSKVYIPKKVYGFRPGTKNTLTLGQLKQGVIEHSGLLPTILGGKRRMLKELEVLKPKFVKSAKIKRFGYLPIFMGENDKRSLSGLGLEGQFITSKNKENEDIHRTILVKPYIASGILTHELQHGISGTHERLPDIAGAIVRQHLGKRPTRTLTDRVFGYSMFPNAEEKVTQKEIQKHRKRILKRRK